MRYSMHAVFHANNYANNNSYTYRHCNNYYHYGVCIISIAVLQW